MVERRPAPAEPRNDGRQTPYRGHPVLLHAVARGRARPADPGTGALSGAGEARRSEDPALVVIDTRGCLRPGGCGLGPRVLIAAEPAG
ncbi:DUF4186 family protein [Streptomyces sp. SYSU K21746]